MNTPWLGLVAWLMVTPPPCETRFAQLAPSPAVASDGDAAPRRRPDITRAAVLIHGLRPHVVSGAAVRRAEPSNWEKSDATIVQALKDDADIYAFHYAQSLPLGDVARHPALARAVRALQDAGYLEIALIGYSAGGVIARQFVEDTPGGGGVTKVIQVAVPNGGSDWSILRHGVRAAQVPFVRSLAKLAATHDRAGVRIPDSVEFVCIVAVCNWVGDGVVRRDAQWPVDLQAQGIPADSIIIPHIGAMYSHRLASIIGRHLRTPQPRWTPEQLAAAKPKVLGWLAAKGE